MKHELLDIDGFLITITFHNDKSELLLEAKSKGTPLIGTYSVIKHPPHTNPGEYHLHVYDGQDQIFAINKSGKAHDGFHGVRIPNKVYSALTQKYKGWTFPPDQIIESLNYTYILNPILSLTYKQILNEIEVLQGEMNFYDRIEKSLLKESITTKAKEQNDLLLKRFQELFIESVKRIS